MRTPPSKTKTHTGLTVTVREAVPDDIPKLQEWVEQGIDEKERLWFFEHIVKGSEADLPLLIVCMDESDKVLCGRFLLALDTQHQVNLDIPPAANFDSIFVHPDWRKHGVCDAMIDYGQMIAEEAGLKWGEIGVNFDNTPPLSNYVRKHFHEHAKYLNAEVFVHYDNVWIPELNQVGYIQTPRYGRSVVCYKDFGARCVEHTKKEAHDWANKLCEPLSSENNSLTGEAEL